MQFMFSDHIRSRNQYGKVFGKPSNSRKLNNTLPNILCVIKEITWETERYFELNENENSISKL